MSTSGNLPSEFSVNTLGLTKEDLLRLYRRLLLARLSEERIRKEYFKDEMKTPVHLGIGQEAIPVGVTFCLPKGAKIFGSYRNHALYLALTEETDRFFGELYGKATGVAKGKAGSMHLSASEEGLMATSAVVGTPIPLAVGAALAHQYRNSGQMSAVFFGDGAVEEGVFWESLNFACLRKLKVLFVCEDNGLAIHTPKSQRQGFRSLTEAVGGFDCHVAEGDGSDLLEVVSKTREILKRMKEDFKPGLLHFTYYRFLEHVGPREDFDAGYRRRPTPEEWERLDPVARFEKTILSNGWEFKEFESLRESIEGKIDQSIRLAESAAYPEPQELITDVLVDGSPPVFPEESTSALTRRTLSFSEALALALSKEMQRDPNVFVFGLDVPDHKRIYGSTQGLLERFGDKRCFGTPLSEEAMTGVALGAAICGLRPVHVHIRADFMLLGTNQIINMVSNLRYMSGGRIQVPLVIRAVIGRGWGQSAQHSKSLHSIFGHIPGLKVVLPSTPQDAYSLLRASVQDDNPVIFLEHRWLYDVVGEVDEGLVLPLGQPVVRRQGDALTVVASSWMNVEALKAAEVLAKRGVDLEVVDVRGVCPLNEEPILKSVEKTKRCIVADYDWLFCGFSAELAARIGQGLFGILKSPVERLGFVQVPCPTARPLENLFYPSAVEIIRTAEKMLGLSPTDLSQESFYTYERRFKGPF